MAWPASRTHHAPLEELSHARHTPARQRCALPEGETTASGGTRSAVLSLQRVVFRYVFWAHSSPSFAAYNVFSWPTSLTDRALSSTELGSARGHVCMPSHADTAPHSEEDLPARTVACWPAQRSQATPSHGMMAAQVDEHDPERERSTWHVERGGPSRAADAGPGGKPETRHARHRPGSP